MHFLRETLNAIMTMGHSRVPVYYKDPTNIIGIILVITLYFRLSIEEHSSVISLCTNHVYGALIFKALLQFKIISFSPYLFCRLKIS